VPVPKAVIRVPLGTLFPEILKPIVRKLEEISLTVSMLPLIVAEKDLLLSLS
jgi:hypothetical protein